MGSIECFIGDGTVKITRIVAVHRGFIQVSDLEAIKQRENGMGLVEVIVNCVIVSISAFNFKGSQCAAYRC